MARDIFGVVKEDGNRQFRTAFVEISKKNGKSELPWQENLYEQVVAEAIPDRIEHGVSADEVKKDYSGVDKHTVDYLLRKAEKLSIDVLDEFELKIKIYRYLSKLTENQKLTETKNFGNSPKVQFGWKRKVRGACVKRC